jgi:zinc transport system substrate-binding protein
MKFKTFLLFFFGVGLISLYAKELPLKIVATFLPIYSHTKNIAGDHAEVEMLLSQDTGPHDFQIKPSDVAKIAKADLLIINGAGLEEWLGELISKAGNKKIVVVDASKDIPLITAEELKWNEDAHIENGSNHEDGGKNPHVWLDPVLAIKQAETIYEALSKADSVNQNFYRENLNKYVTELKKLDEEYQNILGPVKEKNLITFHDAFPYLTQRYHIKNLGYIEGFPEKEPRPSELKRLIEMINKYRVKIIFAEVGYAPQILNSIAKQTGAKVSELDTLEIGSPEKDAYVKRMRENLNHLKSAWLQN